MSLGEGIPVKDCCAKGAFLRTREFSFVFSKFSFPKLTWPLSFVFEGNLVPVFVKVNCVCIT